jgi:hypothetical protein
LNDLRKKLLDADAAYKRLGDSTSEAVKEAHLQRVRELAAQVNHVTKALNEARKSTVHAAGSYNDLSQRVSDAKKRLKEMGDGIHRNSQEFKDLQKFIKEGTVQLKAFDKELGDGHRDVGNYENAIDALDQRTGGFISTIKNLGRQLAALAANPFFLILGAVIALFAALAHSVKSYYDTTIEGEEVAEEQAAVWESFFVVLKKGWSSVGKSVNDFIGGPDGFQATLGSFLAQWSPAMAAVFEITAAKARILAAEMARLWKEHLKDVVDDANTELKVNEKLEESKDKLNKADKERLAAFLEAKRLLKEQTEGDIELAKADLEAQRMRIRMLFGVADETKLISELTNEEIVAMGVKREEIEKLAKFEVALLKVQSDAAAKRKTLNKQEFALYEDVFKTRRDAEHRLNDEREKSDEIYLEHLIGFYDRQAAEEEASLDNIVASTERANEHRLELLEAQKKKELEIVKRAAEERVRAEGIPISQEKQDEFEKMTLDARLIAIEKYSQDYIDARLKNDVAYFEAQTGVATKFTEQGEKLNKESTDRLSKNVFTKLERDAKNLTLTVQTETAKAQAALMSAFNAGNKSAVIDGQKFDISSTEDLEKAKLEIQRKYELESIKLLIESLKIKRNAKAKYGESVVELDKQIAEAELAIEDYYSKKSIENRRAVEEATRNLKQATQQYSVEIARNLFERGQMDRDEEIRRLEEGKEKAVAIAGDNARQREAIEVAYKKKIDKIQEESRRARIRQAKLEKTINLVTATANTAVAVTGALKDYQYPYNIIVAALVGAAGALEIAAIASQPIPQYAVGTDNSAEGWVIINEQGREIVKPVTGSPYMIDSDGPVLTYMQGGSKVYTADESDKMIARGQFEAMGGMMKDGAIQVKRGMVERNESGMIYAINKNFDILASKIASGDSAIVKAIMSQPKFEKDLLGIMKAYTDHQGNKKLERLKFIDHS